MLLIVSFFFALALNPPVSYLARKVFGGRRGLATGIAYITVLTVIGSLLYVMVPPLADQTRQLADRFPDYIENLETSDTTFAGYVRDSGALDQLKDAQGQISDAVGGPIFNFFRGISQSMLSALAVLGLTFFMLVEGPRWLNRFWSLQPKAHEKHRKQLAMRMYRVVTGYVNGQLFIAFLAGLATFIMLTILGLPFALPLGAVVAITGLVPLVGATLGAVIVIIVGLFQSITSGVVLLIFFIVYQQFENYVIHPVVQAKTLKISPLLVLIAAIFGVSIAGLLGALLAIPIAASLRILTIDYIERHHLRHKES